MEVKLTPITKLWQDTGQLFLDHIGYLLLLTLIPQLAWFLVAALLGGAYAGIIFSIGPSSVPIAVHVVAIVILSIVTFFIQLFGIYSLVIYMLNHKKSINLLLTYKLTWKYFVKLFGYTLLVSVLTGAIFLVCLAITSLIFGITGNALDMSDLSIFAGAFLVAIIIAAVPGTIFGLYAHFGNFFIIERNIGPWQALLASFRSVHKNFWEVFARMILFALLLFAVGLMLSIIPYMGQLVNILVFPAISMVYYYMIYQDLKKHP